MIKFIIKPNKNDLDLSKSDGVLLNNPFFLCHIYKMSRKEEIEKKYEIEILRFSELEE